MNITDTVNHILSFKRVASQDRELFMNRLIAGAPFTKHEGALEHLCCFFLPYDTKQGKIYLGHHIKADDWIPPGGHIEPGESPVQTVIREMKEELDYTIDQNVLEPWNLSVKPINNPDRGCIAHYDIWFLLRMPVTNFTFDHGEYYAAEWWDIQEGVARIQKNPDFARIVSLLM